MKRRWAPLDALKSVTTQFTFFYLYHTWLLKSLRGYHFLRKGGPQIYKKSASIKLRPPISATKILWHPHHRYTLPPKQAKIELKSSLFEQNKPTICGHFVTAYILVIKNFMTTPIFLSKNLGPPVYLGPPYSEENDSPQSSAYLLFVSVSQSPWQSLTVMTTSSASHVTWKRLSW